MPSRRSLAVALAGLFLVLLPRPGQAQDDDPMITDRPDFTESASTVAPGRFQFELGYTFTRSGSENRHSFGEFLLRLGILSGLEGRLGLNSFAFARAPDADREGLEDLTLAFKALLHRKRDGSPAVEPQVALLFGVDLPTGESGFGSDKVQPGVKLAADWRLSDRFGLASNVGWAYLNSEGNGFHQAVASLATAYSISDPLTAYLEWYGFFPENRGGGANHYVNGGLAWGLSPDVQLDWRIGAGLQDPSPNWFTGVGLSFRL